MKVQALKTIKATAAYLASRTIWIANMPQEELPRVTQASGLLTEDILSVLIFQAGREGLGMEG